MEPQETEFAESAFRHGYMRQDYLQARRNPKVLFGSRRGDPDVYEMLGRNDAGEYLHVVFRSIREGALKRIVVFHVAAMTRPDRRRYKRMVGR